MLVHNRTYTLNPTRSTRANPVRRQWCSGRDWGSTTLLSHCRLHHTHRTTRPSGPPIPHPPTYPSDVASSTHPLAAHSGAQPTAFSCSVRGWSTMHSVHDWPSRYQQQPSGVTSICVVALERASPVLYGAILECSSSELAGMSSCHVWMVLQFATALCTLSHLTCASDLLIASAG